MPYFYYVADQTPIVPAAHLVHRSTNPVTYMDANPVGTGPFTMSKCTPQVIKYTKNPNYWQTGPAEDRRRSTTRRSPSNDPANQELATGQAQWGSQFIPNIKTLYLSKSPDNHYWFPRSQRRRSSST